MGVHIQDTDLVILEEMVKKASENIEYELEARITRPRFHGLDEISFNRAVSYFFATNADHTQWKYETLDITSEDGFRTTIEGFDDIDEYCRSGVIKSTAITIHKNRDSELSLPQYELKVSLSKEQPQIYVDRRKLLQFRLKKRCSSHYDNHRVDLTIVKSSTRKTTSMANALLNSKDQTYEAEVEYVPNTHGEVCPKSAAKEMLELCSELSKALADTEFLMPVSMTEQVMGVYTEFVKRIMKNHNKVDSANKFIGPSTSTLKRPDLEALYDTNYSVTHKADGERALVIVCGGRIYTINNRLSIKDTGMSCSRQETVALFDAEIVQMNEHAAGSHIMLFDCYCFDAENVHSKHFKDRYKVISTFVGDDEIFQNDSNDEPVFKIVAKKFFISTSTSNASALIFQDDKGLLGYNTDGYIYTPVDTPVESFGSTWKSVFKWKAPIDNTIDFLVEFDMQASTEEFVVLKLYVGANLGKTYGKIPFLIGDVHQTCTVLRQEKGKICCVKLGHTHEEIFNGAIVETSYMESKWRPILIRYDKTELYRSTKSIARTANNDVVARDTFRLILKPITTTMLTSKPDEEKRYYAKDKNTTGTAALYPLRDFHNKMKTDLLLKVKSTTASLLDIACGRGGDLLKWMQRCGFRTVVGIDVNISNVEEIYDRLEVLMRADVLGKNALHQPFKNSRYIFLPMDASSKFGDQLMSIQDKSLRENALMLWGRMKPVHNVHRESLYRLASCRFDTVSCQFAIHYMFKTMATLDNFIDNVDTNLKVNGNFVGTCLDGDAVHAAFTNSGGECLRYPNEGEGELLWSIKKAYTTGDQNTVGALIRSYVVTFEKETEEFLVPFALLTSKLSEKNIYLKSTSMFAPDDSSMVDGLRQFSVLNRWFHFKKDKEADNIKSMSMSRQGTSLHQSKKN